MNIKPEDRPKLIGVGIALLAVVIYLVFGVFPKLLGAKSPDALPAASQTAALTDTPQVSAGSQAPTVTGAPASASPLTDGSDLEKGDIPIAKRDSFKPPVAGAATTPFGAPPTLQASKPSVGPVVQPAMIFPGGPVGGPIGAAPIQPPQLNVELKGVILGEPSIAVLSVNGEVSERLEGDHLGGALVLKRISEGGVTIQDRNKSFPVTVGHFMPGSAPLAVNVPPSR